MKTHCAINFLFIFCWMNTLLYSQEVRIFTLEDFDLKGDVKSCMVITDYGKEEFDFDQNGYLTKLVTRYSDLDYAITYYKYDNGELVEKRVENYREGEFDENTSIANFYEIDTTANRKVIEKIFSYNKEPLDQFEYAYNADNELVSITHTNNDGIDETLVEYADYKGEKTVSYILNEVLLKSIRTSKKKSKGKGEQKIVLTKEFLEGNPIKAIEQTYDTSEKLLSEVKFSFDTKAQEFAPTERITYSYNEVHMLSGTTTKKGNAVETKEYIYQYDGDVSKNWVKQIIIPDNAYTTRKITYYSKLEIIEEE